MYRILSFGLVFLTIASYSQTTIFDYKNPLEYEISGIKVEGLQMTDSKILLSMINLKEGNKITIPGDDISSIIKSLWDKGLFSDVKIEAEKIEGTKIFLKLILLERARLEAITFEGIKKSWAKDLTDELKLTYGSQITENILNKIEYRTHKYLDEKGYILADIKVVKKVVLKKVNRVNINVIIDKKNKVKIEDIVIEGNKEFSATKIRRKFKENKRNSLYNLFSSNKLKKDKLEEDVKEVEDAYKEKGFRNIKITLDTILYKEYGTSKTRAILKYKVEEDKQFFIRKINWLGNKVYTTDMLSRLLKMSEKDAYNQKKLQNRLFSDEDAVSNLYLNNGYLFFNCNPVEVNVDKDSVDLEIRINEGKQAIIDNIIIKGNTKTHENVIRRELITYPGDLFSKEDVIRSIRQLAQLQYFDQEKLNTGFKPIPKPESGTVDMQYELSEVSNDQLELSAGYGGGNFIGSVGLKFGNFSAANFFNPKEWPRFSGDGQELSFRVQFYGNYSQTFSISFTDPWFGGKKANSLSFSVYYTKYTSYGSSYNPYGGYSGYSGYGDYNGYETSQVSADELPSMRTLGINVGLGKRLQWPDDFFQINNMISYKLYMLKDWASFIFPSGNSHSISYTVTIARNSINNPIYPSMGSRISLELSATPPFSAFRSKNFWVLSDEVKANYKTEVYNNSIYSSYNTAEKDEVVLENIRYEELSKKYKLIEYYKINMTFDWYTTLIDKLVLRTQTKFGYLGYYDSKVRSPFEGYYVGGDGFSSYSYYGRENVGVRGYDSGVLTPYSKTSASANSYVKHTLELRYPLTMSPSANIYIFGFAEGANSWIENKDINPFDVKRSAGVGIRIFMPIFGMLGFDLGYGFDNYERKTSSSNKWLPQFILGQTF